MFTEKSLNRLFTVNHESSLLHEVLEGSNFPENSTMYKTSVVMALLKLEYLIGQSLFNDSLRVSKNVITLRNNPYNNLEDKANLRDVIQANHLEGLLDLENSQVVKDGVITFYHEIIGNGIECVNSEIGSAVIGENSIIVRPNVEGELSPKEAKVLMVSIVCWLSNRISNQVNELVRVIESDIMLEGCLG